MKKKILFICSNMKVGGFQKSLISLLRCFDYEKYDVDLLLLDPSGIFMDLIPKEVNILPVCIEPEYFKSGKRAVISMIKEKKWYSAFIRLLSCVLWMYDKSIGAACMVKAIPGPDDHYDVAIDYNGQHILYYLVNKVKADKKISYFHSDYKKWSYYEKMDRKYYKFVDAIVTVSDECVESLRQVFPEYSSKIYGIENINSEKTVNLYPKNSNTFEDGYDGVRLVSVGRVCESKGFDFACEALEYLVNANYNVRWYRVGPVENDEYCEKLIEKHRIKKNMILLGATNNPYDYMRNADLIVHPSRFEGKAVAIEEAKILKKPIVATNFSTVKNQIIDGVTGIIVDMDGKSIYEGIKRLIDDVELRNHIVQKQEKLCNGNEAEVDKLYKLINGD